MEKKTAELFRRKSGIFVVLAILQITKHASAQNTTATPSNSTATPSNSTVPPSTSSAPGPSHGPSTSYTTLPRNMTAGLGDPAEFWCGVPKNSEGVTFTFYGSTHNYTLNCPDGHIQDIPQALTGICFLIWINVGWVCPKRHICTGQWYKDSMPTKGSPGCSHSLLVCLW
ncbi:hypothetical protein WMY93_026745 [Mugilogobius chulae]|uniref:Sushi domain-containing protein n=1 Tax=Mugilogobius chulae TaxID=88201 RepID=A0AAW0MZZ1_9GOBI